MANLQDVVSFLEGRDPIPKNQLTRWFTDPDLEVCGATYAYIEKPQHAARVEPCLTESEIAQLKVDYLKRCLVANHGGEWVHSQFEAAWALVSWLAWQAPQSKGIAPDFIRWLGDLYKAKPEIREIIVTGLLEHVVMSNWSDQLFASWKSDPKLSGALSSAREWKSGGGRAPLDAS